MRRVLHMLLLIALLIASAAWASDIHLSVAGADEPAVEGMVEQHVSDALGPCHYCGCGVAHVLGLPAAEGLTLPATPALLQARYERSLDSCASAPPVKPPRA